MRALHWQLSTAWFCFSSRPRPSPHAIWVRPQPMRQLSPHYMQLWPLYTRGLPRTDEDYASHLTAIAIVNNLHRVPHILNRFLAEMINLRHYAIFWPLLALMQVINYRTLRSRAVVTLWAALLLQIAAITVAYLVVTLWSLDKLIGVSLDRMVLHLTPAAALLIALQWPAYRTPVETQPNP